jgi:DNA repair protein SbcD/Mre11
MAFKILATSDIHLGKSSTGVRGDANETSVRHTWKRIVDLAIASSVDVLALAGDIIDRDDRYFEAIGQLQAGFTRLQEAGIGVIMIAGNHDFDVTTEIMSGDRFSNVTLLGANGAWEVITRQKGNLTVQFAGWSFPSQHYIQNPSKDFNLSGIDTRYPAIGLLHADVGNSESRYAPVDLSSLTALPLNAWILGHVHKPELLHRDPLVLYPGSPHALSAKEQGPHGPVMLTVSESGDIALTPYPLSPVRYGSIKIDVTGAAGEAEIRSGVTAAIHERTTELKNELEAVSYMVWDVTLTGKHPKIREVEAWLVPITETDTGEEGRTRVQVRKLYNEIQPEVTNLRELAREPSPAGRLAETIIALEEGETTPFLEEMIARWKEMARNTGSSFPYQPLLSSAPEAVIKGDQQAKQMIMNECNRLLSELLAQQEK